VDDGAWNEAQIPDLSDKIAIVTGANSGIGFEAAQLLAGAGAHVVLACRNFEKTDAAIGQISATHKNASLEDMLLDLADLASIHQFVDAFNSQHQQLDILCNNAGVMALPYRTTRDGFEMQFGTNHLGHFALTGLLSDTLIKTSNARVVNVSSLAHRMGKMRFDDLHGQKRYEKWAAYGQSKLANLLFTYELQRRFDKKGVSTKAVACHPGYSATNLQYVGPIMQGSRVLQSIMRFSNNTFAQSARAGAWPTVYAAVAEEVQGGDFIGPDGFMEFYGKPKKVRSNAASHDPQSAARLWEVSESHTKITYQALS
jgi:hypothetical protein